MPDFVNNETLQRHHSRVSISIGWAIQTAAIHSFIHTYSSPTNQSFINKLLAALKCFIREVFVLKETKLLRCFLILVAKLSFWLSIKNMLS